MFALIASIIMFLAAFDVKIDNVNLPLLSAAFFFLHFAWAIVVPALPTRRNPPA